MVICSLGKKFQWQHKNMASKKYKPQTTWMEMKIMCFKKLLNIWKHFCNNYEHTDIRHVKYLNKIFSYNITFGYFIFIFIPKSLCIYVGQKSVLAFDTVIEKMGKCPICRVINFRVIWINSYWYQAKMYYPYSVLWGYINYIYG